MDGGDWDGGDWDGGAKSQKEEEAKMDARAAANRARVQAARDEYYSTPEGQKVKAEQEAKQIEKDRIYKIRDIELAPTRLANEIANHKKAKEYHKHYLITRGIIQVIIIGAIIMLIVFLALNIFSTHKKTIVGLLIAISVIEAFPLFGLGWFYFGSILEQRKDIKTQDKLIIQYQAQVASMQADLDKLNQVATK